MVRVKYTSRFNNPCCLGVSNEINAPEGCRLVELGITIGSGTALVTDGRFSCVNENFRAKIKALTYANSMLESLSVKITLTFCWLDEETTQYGGEDARR